MKLDVASVKKRLQPRSVLAITLESDRLAVSVARRETSGSPSGFTLPFGADSVFANPERAGTELLAQLDATGIKERRCVVCLPTAWAMSASTELPEVSAEDLRGYLELRAEREFPMPASEARLAYSAYSLPDGKRRATLAAIPLKRMEAVEKMLAAAACKAVSISLGLQRCVRKGDSPAAMHFLANGSHVDVVIAAGGGIATIRTLDAPLASEDVFFDAAAFCREVRITLGRLPEAIREQVHDVHFGGVKTSAETLCVKTRDHLRRMGIEPASIDRSAQAAEAAVEAAEQFLRDQPPPFEFVQTEAARWEVLIQRFDSSRRRWLVLAGLGLVLLPIVAFAIQSHREKSLTSEWNAMRNNVEELEVLQKKIREFRPWFEAMPETLQAIDALVGAFPEGGEVWAKTIQINEEHKVTCTGFTRNETALAAMIERLRARKEVSNLARGPLRGENPIQFSISYKWEPKNAK